MKTKVLLGMSGGVDSSVAAVLLKEQGYDVIGVTMKLWEDENNESSCCSLDSVYDAKRVCDILNIPHYVFDLKKEFKEYVIDDFIQRYENGETPNPCIECNKYLKFDIMKKKAKQLGIEYIATGHYAKTEFSQKYNKFVLKKSDNLNKDQTYALYNIPDNIIKNVIFPLGNFKDKNEIREIAKKYNLITYNKPESQEICFIPNNNYVDFLKDKIKNVKNGNILDTKGNILGKHNGIFKFTIGQRKGLGISTKTSMYVVKIDNNNVIVGNKDDIYSNTVYIKDINYILFDVKEEINITAKIRYSAKEEKATLYPINNNEAKVIFENKVRAVTPGQSIVFYINDYVLGGGLITVNSNL